MIKFIIAGFLLTILNVDQAFSYTLNGSVVPDYTDVGYKRGNEAIPTLPATVTYPAGVFTITKKINLIGARQVLRGAGKDKTFLYFPSGLVGMGYGCNLSVDPNDCWDWDGGVIDIIDGRMSGVEDLTIVFPEHLYAHHKGQGFNGIKCGNCTNTWIKNVGIKHADVGISYIGGHHNTNIHQIPLFGTLSRELTLVFSIIKSIRLMILISLLSVCLSPASSSQWYDTGSNSGFYNFNPYLWERH